MIGKTGIKSYNKYIGDIPLGISLFTIERRIIMAKILVYSDGMIEYPCPGCEDLHVLNMPGLAHHWEWNGDKDCPTFSPSILVRSGHYVPGHKGECWCKFNANNPDEKPDFECSICHSFIRNGKIEFLNDCTHELKGKTVKMEDYYKET